MEQAIGLQLLGFSTRTPSGCSRGGLLIPAKALLTLDACYHVLYALQQLYLPDQAGIWKLHNIAMSRQSNFRGPIPANASSNERRQSKAEEKGMWSSMLDSVASGKKLPEKNMIVLGGGPETQKEFLETLASDAPKRPQDRHRTKPVVANEFALGYTYQDVLDADHEGKFSGEIRAS